ncbi:hypothetical protein NDU88_001353 [Pleurodeles waltl]|uniref:Uncharacterized protein n=1 Tax=Pleurodeles waltl TaxID=8319 RepID=A0AAV7L0J7_PLEWA|nr:hypothetical protein NDU88_001353 [Pleurodeles waltl]
MAPSGLRTKIGLIEDVCGHSHIGRGAQGRTAGDRGPERAAGIPPDGQLLGSWGSSGIQAPKRPDSRPRTGAEFQQPVSWQAEARRRVQGTPIGRGDHNSPVGKGEHRQVPGRGNSVGTRVIRVRRRPGAARPPGQAARADGCGLRPRRYFCIPGRPTRERAPGTRTPSRTQPLGGEALPRGNNRRRTQPGTGFLAYGGP